MTPEEKVNYLKIQFGKTAIAVANEVLDAIKNKEGMEKEIAFWKKVKSYL